MATPSFGVVDTNQLRWLTALDSAQRVMYA